MGGTERSVTVRSSCYCFMSVPLVSVCLPNLNTRPFLKERMETIFAQTFSDWELIISDNYSDDGAWEFLQKFKCDPRVHLWQSPRQGMYANWNECLRRARGRYCYIATSDDTMSPVCLEQLLKPLEAMPTVKIANCNFLEINEAGMATKQTLRPQHEFLGEWMMIPSLRDGKSEFLLHAAFGTTVWVTMTSVLFRRDLLSRSGLFRTDLGSRADEEWALRAALASSVAYVPKQLATWRIHSSQATANWDPRHRAWVMFDCIRSVLRDRRVGIPDAWRSVPHWRRELSAVHRSNFQRSLGLYRWEAKRHPVRFCRGVLDACRFMPDHFAHRLLEGFGPSASESDIDPLGRANRLIALFDAPWPPQVMDWDKLR